MIIEAWEPIWGGGQAHAFELSKKLSQNHDCRIDIFTMNFLDENNNKQAVIEELENGKIRIIRTGKTRAFSFSDRIFWMLELICTIKKFNQEINYNLIHAHANLPGIPGKILSKLMKIPTVYTIHGSGVESMSDMYGKSIKSFFLSKIENYLHCKINYTREISVDRKILSKKNINKEVSIISNGVDIEKFESIQENKYRIFKIIFVGRLHPQKGLDFLLEATNKIKNELSGICELHIIGEGKLEKIFKEKIKKYKIENIIKFRGRMSGIKLTREYKSSHLFILPSIFEGQPLTLLEAWASKLPVIVTDVGDNKYFVKNNINGYIIPPQDITALSDKMLKAIKNPHLKVLGENGYQLVKNNYTWDIVAKKTYAIYSEIVG